MNIHVMNGHQFDPGTRFSRFHMQPQSAETVNAQADPEKNTVEGADVFPCRLPVAREMIRVRRLPRQATK